MAGPWEQYQTPAAAPAASGPWSQYSETPAQPRDTVPGPRAQRPGVFTKLGRSAAGLADTVVGIVPQAIAETGYAGVRALEGVGLAKPGQAQRGKAAFLREFGTPFGSAFGVAQTPEYQSEASQRFMQFIGENVSKGADWISANTGVPKADVENAMFTLGFTTPAAARRGKQAYQAAAPYVKEAAATVAETAPAQAVIKPLQERAAKKQEARVAQSFENAAKIDASKLAVKYNVIVNPAESNPTVRNRLTAGAAKATNFSENAAKLNDARFTQLAKEDMGLPANTVLDSDAIQTALAAHDAPYNAVGQIPRLSPDSKVLGQIESLRIKRPLIGGEKNAAAVNSLVDETLAKIEDGRSGAEINADISNLRREANQIYTAQQKGGVPDSTLIARADANIKLANALEDLIDANAPNPQVLADLRKARAAKAKIFDYERALNNQTNRIDPQVLAKMAKEKKPLSGIAADIAKIASVFPDIAQTGQTGQPTWAKGLTRSGAAGTAGLATAALVGAPLIPGAVIGAGLGYVGGGLTARRMASPAYQAKYAVPQDFRPPVVENNLRPVTPSNTPNLPVPFDFRNAMVDPSQIPNWVFAESVPPGAVRMQPPSAPALEAPSAASTMRMVEQRRRFDYESQKAAEEAAAARQTTQEAAGRAPTSGEVILELDPTTGKLRSVSQGMKGATPDVIESTGKSLASAADKIASGQRFRLSADEKVAWEKTKTDLSVIDASFAKLSDKALAEKALDRAWVADAVAKAKQKAAAFADIEKRSKDAQQVARARMERERLMDVLESLEPQLSRSRATSVGEQGPKTREAIRNRLAGKNQNNLRND